MASTLLAVDDSVTMRKVLEITFAGQDYVVVTAVNADSALQKLKSDKPALVIADGTLEPKNGYDLCKEIKKISPTTPVLFLSSKQNPFDAAKGSGAQVDDHMDKPFDTQQMIDKVKKLLAGGVVAKPAAAAATVASTSPTAPSMPVAAAPPVAAPPLAQTRNAGVPTAQGGATAPAPTAQTPMQRAKTLIYNPPNVAATPAPAAPPAAAKAPAVAPTPAAGMPQQSRSATIESPALPPAVAQTVQTPLPRELATAAAAVSGTNGQMSGKLEQLGLTPQQIEAVLALSREVVEKVVWEVVPVLAESIIKEEIARLTK